MASSDNIAEANAARVQHSTFKHQVVAWVSQHIFGSVVYTVRNGRLKGMKRKGGLGWIPRERQSTPEDAFWNNINLRGKVVYDVGAFEGMLTLYFARSAKRVVSYEPNSRNYRRLAENVRLNDLRNVTLRTIGMGKENAQVAMVQDPLVPGMASVAVGHYPTVGNSQATVEQVQVRTMDSDIVAHAQPAPDFIKIDIEGMELDALQGAEETIATAGRNSFSRCMATRWRKSARRRLPSSSGCCSAATT